MNILETNSEGKVVATENGKDLKELVDLYSTDRHQGKPFYNEVITFAFYMFKKNGIYSNYLPAAREEIVIRRHLPGVNSKKIYEHGKAKTFIEYYQNDEKSVLDRSWEAILRDIEDTIKWLNSIEYKKKVKVEIEIDIPREAGSQEMIKYPIKQWIDVDNSDEKRKALKTLEDLFSTIERFETKIESQRLKSKKEMIGHSLFDN